MDITSILSEEQGMIMTIGADLGGHNLERVRKENDLGGEESRYVRGK